MQFGDFDSLVEGGGAVVGSPATLRDLPMARERVAQTA
jgi:hypothetical protein